MAYFMNEADVRDEDVKRIIFTRLQGLHDQFRENFPYNPREGDNPFVEEAFNSAALPSTLRDKLVDLSCDGTLKLNFSKQILSDFWLSVRQTLFVKL